MGVRSANGHPRCHSVTPELSRTSIEGIRTLGRLAVHLDPALSSFSAMRVCVAGMSLMGRCAVQKCSDPRIVARASCCLRVKSPCLDPIPDAPAHGAHAVLGCTLFHDMQLSSLRRAWNNFH